MEQPGTPPIVIPTGRNSFCCIVPCALMAGLYGIGSAGAAVLIWHHLRRRTRR